MDKREEEDEEGGNINHDDQEIQKYFSNGEGQKSKAEEDDADEFIPQPLSLEDLMAYEPVEEKEVIQVMPEFDNNQFWKVDQGMDLEALLQDYQ